MTAATNRTDHARARVFPRVDPGAIGDASVRLSRHRGVRGGWKRITACCYNLATNDDEMKRTTGAFIAWQRAGRSKQIQWGRHLEQRKMCGQMVGMKNVELDR